MYHSFMKLKVVLPPPLSYLFKYFFCPGDGAGRREDQGQIAGMRTQTFFQPQSLGKGFGEWEKHTRVGFFYVSIFTLNLIVVVEYADFSYFDKKSSHENEHPRVVFVRGKTVLPPTFQLIKMIIVGPNYKRYNR